MRHITVCSKIYRLNIGVARFVSCSFSSTPSGLSHYQRLSK
ncbi:hypothetical protein FOQG_19640 [Fusarium oxysporum f. sp. raphani 54005]|uniref:Uncharacterized protein n=1 Tax=Fusarium oxysporum f. sp. raphani 54005 TaxID=1089458 RepID=X0B9U2_FUSOX|nr:hypothetical protein FOQG_19640 [Fusarium oxysporum f. sp. raphani 54005]